MNGKCERKEIKIMDFDPNKKYPKGSVVVIDDDMSWLEEKLDIPEFLKDDKKEEDGEERNDGGDV